MRALAGVLLCAACARTAPRTIEVATTTSVEATGFLGRAAPAFEAKSGLRLRVLAVGTGQALRLLERGDVGAVITHDPEAEEKLAARGVAQRAVLMENGFVLVGPPEDPAQVKGLGLEAAFRALAEGRAAFVSRGDDSGTHRAEKRAWKYAGVETPHAPPYRETGQGMGETLVIASELSAYTLVDSGTLATFARKIALVPLVQGDPRLKNIYSVLWRSAEGERFAAWLRSDEARGMMRPHFEPAAR
jgi:tungstate transport system substrate-binding protein